LDLEANNKIHHSFPETMLNFYDFSLPILGNAGIVPENKPR
jgi:hypothetical protein